MRSSRYGCVWAGVLAAAWLSTASGQVRIELKLGHVVYLQFEPVFARVTLGNDSYDAFVVDARESETANRIDFAIRTEGGDTVRRSGEEMTSRIEVEPGERQEVMIDISQPYGLARAGRYFVAARAQVNGRRYESNRLAFDVVPGIELASTTRSLPGYADLVRHYSLRYWDRDQREYLFLRVDGERGENYGLFELGPLIRVFPPGIDVDKFGNVKVVHQSGGNRFTHSTFISSRDGVRFVDQVFRRADGRDYRAGAEPEPADKTGKPDAEKPSKGSKTSDGGAKGGK